MAYLPHKRTLSSSSLNILPKPRPAQHPVRSRSDASAGVDALSLAPAPPEQSWLQRRLKSRTKGDRAFFTLVRARRERPSRLSQRLSQRPDVHRPKHQLWQRLVVLTTVCATLGGATWTNLFLKNQVTLAGVPYQIIDKFWSDKSARDAYFIGDKEALHDRLKSLGIEADIKYYYRDQFASEHELDKHIHQIMFERTGYVGEAYRVNNMGELLSISY